MIENDDNDDKQDLVALITRGLERIIRMKKKYENFKRINNNKGKFYSQNKSNKVTCFKCGSIDDVVKECPEKKKDYYKRDKQK